METEIRALDTKLAFVEPNAVNQEVKSSTKELKDEFPISSYNPRISRRLMEAVCGISTNTLVKYETEGLIKPEKVKQGGREVVMYRASDIQTIHRKRGVNFKQKSSAEIIAVFSQKGGVGKSSYCAQLATVFSTLLGLKTLVIDLDSQGDLSNLLDVRSKSADVLLTDQDELDPTICELMDWTLSDGSSADYRKLEFDQVIRKISPTLSIIPADLDLGEINFSLNRLNLSERFFSDGRPKAPPELYMVSDVVEKLKSQYDVIIYDCPPNIETLNISALLSCNRILVPVEMEAKTLLTVRRNEEFFKRLRAMHSGFNFEKILLVPNKYRINETIKTKALWALQEIYKDRTDIQLSEAVVPSSVIIDYCADAREPLFVTATRYGRDLRSKVSSAQEFSDYFWAIAHEILGLPLNHLLFSKTTTAEV